MRDKQSVSIISLLYHGSSTERIAGTSNPNHHSPALTDAEARPHRCVMPGFGAAPLPGPVSVTMLPFYGDWVRKIRCGEFKSGGAVNLYMPEPGGVSAAGPRFNHRLSGVNRFAKLCLSPFLL
jgi:hypothetical protein